MGFPLFISVSHISSPLSNSAWWTSDMQALECVTATNTMIGVAYTYGLHPNASARRTYDGVWKREYAGGGSVIVAYAEEPATRQIFVGISCPYPSLPHPPIPAL